MMSRPFALFAPLSSAAPAVFAVTLGLAALGTGCKKPAPEAVAKKEELAPVKVGVQPVREGDVPRFLTITGSLLAERDSDVAADSTGKVLQTPIERGAFVKQGQLLAQLDTRSAGISAREAQSSAALASAQADIAKSDCERAEKLYKGGAMSEADHDKAMAACKQTALSVEVAQARRETAAKMLGDATIRAPFSGLVVERYVDVGEYVRPDTKVARIVTIDPLRVQLAVPELGASQVKDGSDVRFQVAAFPDEVFLAKVKFVSPALREQTRDLVVEASIGNADGRLRPGMFATVKLALPRGKGLVVPKAAVKTDGAASRLYVVKDGKLEQRVVELGEADGEAVEVKKGVAGGEQVVSPWSADARDGAEALL